MIRISKAVLGLALMAAWGATSAQGSAIAPADNLRPAPARPSPAATSAPLLGAAWAGNRAVAVGEHGVVLLSDQGGAFRQARSVPVSSALTAVAFADAKNGWAVGHWGAILASADGGESWAVQRLDTQEDRPLFAVHFFDAQRGVAVGLWSLVLTTADGGKTWISRSVPPPPDGRKADLNLFSLFQDAHGSVYATAERGYVLRSLDQGQTWEYLETGAKASLWAGVVLPDGALLVGGQGGALLRASSPGGPWKSVSFDSKRSVTDISVTPTEVFVVGLDGLRARSVDGGQTYTAIKETGAASAMSLTAVLTGPKGTPTYFSRYGVLRNAVAGGGR